MSEQPPFETPGPRAHDIGRGGLVTLAVEADDIRIRGVDGTQARVVDPADGAGLETRAEPGQFGVRRMHREAAARSLRRAQDRQPRIRASARRPRLRHDRAGGSPGRPRRGAVDGRRHRHPRHPRRHDRQDRGRDVAIKNAPGRSRSTSGPATSTSPAPRP